MRIHQVQRITLAIIVLCVLGLLHRQLYSIKSDVVLDDSDGKPQIVQSYAPRQTQIRRNFNGSESMFSHPLENTCKYPIIYTDEKDIEPYVEHYREMKCTSDEPNLVSMDSEGYIYVHNELNMGGPKKELEFACFYRAMTGGLFPNISVFTWSSEEHEIPKSKRFWINEDQFVVRCYNSSHDDEKQQNASVIFDHVYAHFANKNKTYEDATPDRLSLSILVLDSTSLNQFRRHAPRTLDFMQKLGFEFLQGYNKVADNSLVNLMPVLTNLIYTNLSAAIVNDILPLTLDERVIMEKINFPWNEMKGNVGANQISNISIQCTQDRPSTEVYLDIWEQFSMKFKDKCHFSFNFLTDLTHDDPSYLEVIDERLRTSLERFYANSVMDNTVFVVMGDHGNRMAAIRHSFVGKIEERMPLFSILLPDSFKQRFPTLVSNLRINTNRFVSNFDIYQTLKDLYSGRYSNEEISRVGRGISLFDIIPTDRSCKDATVPENFCTCMERRNLRQKKDSKKSNATVSFVTEFLASGRFSCIQPDSIEVETIESYSINQMVHRNLRDMSEDSLKRLNAPPPIDYVYVELGASIALLSGERVKFLTRVQLYVFDRLFRMNAEPLIIDSNALTTCRSSRTIDELCLCYF